MPLPAWPGRVEADPERLAHGRAHVVGERHLGARLDVLAEHARSPRWSRCGAVPGGAIGAAPSNGRPEAWASRCRTVDAGRPGRLVEIDDALLGGDERRERAHGLRHGGERTGRRASPRVAIVAVCTVTPAAANGTSQPSIWRRASTCGRYYPGTWSAA